MDAGMTMYLTIRDAQDRSHAYLCNILYSAFPIPTLVNYFNVLRFAFFLTDLSIFYYIWKKHDFFFYKKRKHTKYLEQTHNYVMCYEMCYKIWYDAKWNTNCKIYSGKKRNMYRISLYYFVHLWMNENIPRLINRNKRKEGANRKLVKKDSNL